MDSMLVKQRLDQWYLCNHIVIVWWFTYEKFVIISHSQELNVNLQQIEQIKRFWYRFKEENHTFQTKKKLIKLVEKKESYNEIEFIIE